MRLFVDASPYTFMVTKSSGPKLDQDGKQKYRKGSNAPMWVTEVLALDKENEGGETIAVTVEGVKPEFTVGQMVRPVGLEAIPWMNNGRHGVAYRAGELVLEGQAVGAA